MGDLEIMLNKIFGGRTAKELMLVVMHWLSVWMAWRYAKSRLLPPSPHDLKYGDQILYDMHSIIL